MKKLGWVLVILFCSACPKTRVQVPDFGNLCRAPGNQVMAPECCSDPQPASCPTKNPAGSGAMRAAATAAADSARDLKSAIAQLKEIEDKAPAGLLANSNAATATGEGIPVSGVVPALKVPGVKGIQDAPARSEGSGVLSGAAIQLGANLQKSQGELGISGSKSERLLEGDGAYASAGRGAPGANKVGLSNWSIGGDLDASAGAKVANLQLGKSKGELSSEKAALLSEDPEDYFSRSSLDDSLFKIVERRYQSQQASWSKLH